MKHTMPTADLARPLLVAALGNPDRGDDAAGVLVARALAGRLPRDIALVAVAGDVLSLLDVWHNYHTVICVDALASLEAPGRIHRLDLMDDALPKGLGNASTHAFGLADAVEMARVMGLAPERVVVYAVTGSSFGIGAAPARQVAEAATRVADCILDEVETLGMAGG